MSGARARSAKVHGVGRGAHYSRARRAVEATLSRAFAGAWPARAAARLGLQGGVRVVRHAVRSSSPLPRALRIAFASDFHAGPTTHRSQLAAACDALSAARPDVLLLGGDFVLFDAAHIDALAPLLAAIEAPLGKFAVLGNHDLWADDARIFRALAAAGVQVLINEAARLRSPFEGVAICGLDEPWTGAPDAGRALDVDAEVRVLLMHSPDGLALAAGAPAFALALCGHTHGGHLALPGGVPIVVPGPLGRRYAHGRFAIDDGSRDATLIVSRGVGASEVPFRTFAPADVVLCDLVPSGRVAPE